MRISDWSSDVCSSDLWKLRRILDRDGDITIVYEEFLEEGAGRRSLSLTRRSGEKDQPVLAPEQAQILDDARMQSERAESRYRRFRATQRIQNGSAPWRERACQYVSISVVA